RSRRARSRPTARRQTGPERVGDQRASGAPSPPPRPELCQPCAPGATTEQPSTLGRQGTGCAPAGSDAMTARYLTWLTSTSVSALAQASFGVIQPQILNVAPPAAHSPWKLRR